MHFQDAFFPTVDVHPFLGFQENYLQVTKDERKQRKEAHSSTESF